jgi:hypothetical protein
MFGVEARRTLTEGGMRNETLLAPLQISSQMDTEIINLIVGTGLETCPYKKYESL